KDNELIDMDKDYTIVLSNYRASNTSVYPAYENAEVLKEINIDMSEIIMDYLQKKQQIKLIDESNYVVKY
ncbi:MAG: bifunctional metallophosphatase/5'-nucleotidase, partial [Clostridium baratii]|nr:bifunctional metallophosphatase/5'-nucleotidase [Clostridium baratii]